MVTIKEMANRLGVSTTTISNVIHGKTSEVSPATIELVRKTIEECGYIPNINARNLAQNQSGIIGIVMKERKGQHENMIADPFYGELTGAVEKVVRTKDKYLMLCISDNMDDIIKSVKSWNVDGLIVVSLDYEDILYVRSVYKNFMVLIDCHVSSAEVGEVNITLDDRKGAYDITEYLIRSGHRKIAYVTFGKKGIVKKRYEGCIDALEAYGLPTNEDSFPVVCVEELGLNGALEAAGYLAGEYTAFICSSDYYAAHLINYLEDRGISVPGDVSVTGFDDNDYAKMVRPHLTTLHQDVNEKGMWAARLLLDMIEKKEKIQRDIILPFRLVVRDSVKILRTEE